MHHTWMHDWAYSPTITLLNLLPLNDLHRIREGDYRIIYTIQGKELIVLVVKIGNRKDVSR